MRNYVGATSSSISDLQEVTRRSGSVALTNLLGSSQSLLRQHGPTITNFLFLFSSFVIAIVCETGPKMVSLRFGCSAKQCCSSCYWLGRHGKKTSKEYICIYIPSWLGWMENNAELHWLARAPSVSTMPFCSVGVWQGIRVMDVRASVGIQPFFFFFHFIVLAVGRIKGTTFPIASCIHFSHFLPFGSLHTHTHASSILLWALPSFCIDC